MILSTDEKRNGGKLEAMKFESLLICPRTTECDDIHVCLKSLSLRIEEPIQSVVELRSKGKKDTKNIDQWLPFRFPLQVQNTKSEVINSLADQPQEFFQPFSRHDILKVIEKGLQQIIDEEQGVDHEMSE